MARKYAKRCAINDKTADLLSKAKAKILLETNKTTVSDDTAIYEALNIYTKGGKKNG